MILCETYGSTCTHVWLLLRLILLIKYVNYKVYSLCAGDIVPRDSSVVLHTEVILPMYLYASMCAMSTFGILLTTFFLGINIVFRDRRYVFIG